MATLEDFKSLFHTYDSSTQDFFLIANYRTGSTNLALMIGNLFSVKYMQEVYCKYETMDCNMSAEDMRRDPNEPKLFTIMPTGIQYLDRFDLTTAYFCKLTRRDRVAQLASLYISEMIRIWNIFKGDNLQIGNIRIDEDRFDKLASRFISDCQKQDSLEIKYDLELVYEDLTLFFSLEQSNTLRMPKPKNYEEILLHSQKRLNII